MPSQLKLQSPDVISPALPVALFDNYYAPTLAFLTSLGAKGVPVHVYGSSRWSILRWSRYCTEFRLCPPVDCYEEFLPWLREQVRSGAISRVAPTSDLLVYYLAVLRDEFPEAVRRTIPTLAEVETCLIKTRFTETVSRLGLAIPDTCAPNSLEAALACGERIGYPMIVKPRSHLVVGMAERGMVVWSVSELRQKFRPYGVQPGHETLAERYPDLRWPLLQKFVPSAQQRVYSVSGIKDPETGIAALLTSFKCEQWPPRVGVSVRQINCDDQDVRRAGIAAVDALLSRGLFEIELLADGERLDAIDLNPRGFGFMALDVALGNDLPWLWLQSTCGPIRPVAVRAAQPRLECRFVVPFYFSRLLALLHGPDRWRKLADLWREFRRPSVDMIGQWRDPIPALFAQLTILRHPRHLFRTGWRAATQGTNAQPHTKSDSRSMSAPTGLRTL